MRPNLASPQPRVRQHGVETPKREELEVLGGATALQRVRSARAEMPRPFGVVRYSAPPGRSRRPALNVRPRGSGTCSTTSTRLTTSKLPSGRPSVSSSPMWARPGARHTRDLEDVVAWLAQQMAFAPIARLLRVGWHTIGPIVARVVADHLDEDRLEGLVCIGVDEISYRRHHRYLTSVADHATGAIVWCAPGRNSATLQGFFDQLGDRCESIRAVSIDMSGEYQRALRAAVPQAEICFDPFHVVRLGARATDQVRRDEWNAHERSHTATGRWVKGTRWSLLKAPEHQTIGQLATLADVQDHNRRLYRAFLLREELRLLYHLPDPALAREHLDAWLAWASRSRLRPFVRLARTLRTHHDGILAAIRLGLSNGRLEGLNSKIRLISHRAFGFHSPQPLIALVYLCCAGITIELPR